MQQDPHLGLERQLSYIGCRGLHRPFGLSAGALARPQTWWVWGRVTSTIKMSMCMRVQHLSNLALSKLR